jgi:hypothetical protein
MERIAVSMPKTRVMYPMRKIAILVSLARNSSLSNIPGNVTMASPRQFLDKTLRREVLCTATKIICCITAPQASTSGKVSAEWTFRRALNRLVKLAGADSILNNHVLLAQRNLYSSRSPRVRDDPMDRKQCQGQAESPQRQVHCPEGLHLRQLKARDHGSCLVLGCPGHLTDGRSVEGHVEVRPSVELGKVKTPSFHLVRPGEEDTGKPKSLAGNQQRLKEAKVTYS